MHWNPDALLLTDGELPVMGQRLGRMLEFFGVSWRTLPPSQVRDELGASRASRCRLLGRADHFLQMAEALDRHQDGWRVWQRQVHSAFIYAADDREILDRLLARLCDGGRWVERSEDGAEIAVTTGLDEFCGVMSGIRAAAPPGALADVRAVESCTRSAVRIVTAGKGAVFLKVEHQKVPVFIALSPAVVDLDG